MQTVHGDRQCFMCFLRNGTVGHRSGLKSFYNGFDTLYFLDRHTFFRIIKIHQASQITGLFFVYQIRVLFEQVVIASPGRLLQQMNGLRIVTVMFSGTSHFMPSDAVQCFIYIQSQRIKCSGMQFVRFFCNIFHCDTTDTADRICEIFIDHFFINADCLKNLRSLIRLDCGNSHFGSNLYDSAKDSLIVIFHSCIIILIQHLAVDQLMDRIQCQIWVDRTCTITKQCSKMMHFSWFAGFQNDCK